MDHFFFLPDTFWLGSKDARGSFKEMNFCLVGASVKTCAPDVAHSFFNLKQKNHRQISLLNTEIQGPSTYWSCLTL